VGKLPAGSRRTSKVASETSESDHLRGSLGGRPCPTVAAYKHQGSTGCGFESRCALRRAHSSTVERLKTCQKPLRRLARPYRRTSRTAGPNHDNPRAEVPAQISRRGVITDLVPDPVRPGRADAQSIHTGLPAAHPPRAEGSTPSPRAASTPDAGVTSAPATRTAQAARPSRDRRNKDAPAAPNGVSLHTFSR
jgi:hypothetical protein